jgi:hypothetical protein
MNPVQCPAPLLREALKELCGRRVVEDAPPFCQDDIPPGVIADHHILPDVGREGGIEIAKALKANAVPLNATRFRYGEKQEVELCEALGEAWEKSSGFPSRLGGRRFRYAAADGSPPQCNPRQHILGHLHC